MARETTGAIHIASIGLDISGVRSALEESEELIKQSQQTIAQYLNVNSTEQERYSFLERIGIDKDSIVEAEQKIDELFRYIGNVSRVQIKAKDGELFQAIITSADKAEKKVIDLTEALGQFQDKEIFQKPTSTTATFDYSKQIEAAEKAATAAEKAADAEQKAWERADQQAMKAADSAIDKLQNLSKAYSDLAEKTQKADILPDVKAGLAQNFQEAQTYINGLINDLATGAVTAEEAQVKIRGIGNVLDKLKGREKAAEGIKKELDDIATAAEKAADAEQKAWERADQQAMKAADSAIDKLQNLSKAYSDLAEKTQKADILPDVKAGLAQNFQEAQTYINGLINDLATGAVTAEEAQVKIRGIGNVLDKLKGREKAAEGIKKELDDIATAAEKAAKSADNFDLSKLNKRGKTELQQLKVAFENLSNAIKNGSQQDVKAAQAEFDKLNAQLEQIGRTSDTTKGAIDRFLTSLGDKAKWAISFKAVNAIEQAFGKSIEVIKDTENAVVELKRVLNENVSNTAISEALYDIAYKYGQSFQNVQESAVLFAQTGKSWQETLAATEATMLALNTAELDTTQATSGLIAVMSQFKIDADDLEEVIDKINKTADNFPVTSEKIVSALQRTGATAHTAGMSLEETIATITALSEATGRSGENIGTALNALIQYSQKAKSLDVFAGVSDKMADVVQAYKSGSVNILKVWEELGREINNLTDQQQKALFNIEEFQEFADSIESEASDHADSIKEIYGAVGTYRQTYFISLLNNMDTVKNALEEMAGAEGYSLRENEVAMDSLSHRYEQFKASLQDLAVQIGNSGLLDLAKGIVSVTAAILKAIGASKQLIPLIIGVASAITLVRAESAAMAAQSKLAALKQGWINLKSVITGTAVATETATTAATGFAAAFGTFTLAISIIGAIVQGIKAIEQHAREARAEVIQFGKDAKKSAEEIAGLYGDYTSNSKNDLGKEEALKGLLEESGISTKDIEKRIALRKEETGEIINESQALEELLDLELQEKANALDEANEARIKAIKDETEARKELADVSTRIRSVAQNLDLSEDFELYNTMKEFANTISYLPQDIDEVNSYIEILTNTLSELQAKEIETGQELISDEDVAKIEAQIEYYQKLSKEYEENKIQAELMRLGIIEYSKALERSKEENDAMVKAIMEATGATEEQAQATLDAADAIEQYNEAIDSLIDKTKDMENSYDKVVKAIKEYNETGKITADTLRDIVKLGPEYMELLEFEGNQAKINKEAYEKLNGEYKKSMLALESLATEGNRNRIVMNAAQSAVNQLASSESNTAGVTDSFRSKVMELTSNLINGKISSDQYRAQLVLLAQQMNLTAAAAQELALKVNTANAMMKSFMIGIGQAWNLGGGTTVVSGGGGSGGGGGKAKTAAEILEEQVQELKKVYDDEVNAIEHQIFLSERNKKPVEESIAYYRQLQEKAHQQAEKYRAMGVAENSKYLIELSKAWFSYQDDIEDLLEGEYEKQINEYKNALNLLEHYYDAAEARFDVDTMQSNLKAQISVQQRIMQSAYDEYVRLINKGKDANDDAVQDAIDTYYDAAEKIRDINSKIADNILGLYDDFIDLADSLDVWDRLNFTKVEYLEEKLHEINRLYKDGTILLKEYKELLEDTAVDYYNARKAALEKQQEDIEAERDSIIERYNAEIEDLKKRKEESDNYYDALIENLREVSDNYDRINQQLDYYTNRQKILTNIEQAQARSGIEWREKEMQYQQQLIELDESWRRTQEDWSISDQITELERLKEQAASDIEASIEQIRAYIEAAKNTAAASIKDIQNEVDELKYKIYDAITKAMQESVENAATAIGGTMAELTEDTEQAANDSQNAWQQEFSEPIKAEIVAIGQMMKDQLVEDGAITAKNLADVFRQYFISPIKQEINSLMSDVTAGKGTMNNLANGSNSVYNNRNTANIYANIGNQTVGEGLIKSALTGFFLYPGRKK